MNLKKKSCGTCALWSPNTELADTFDPPICTWIIEKIPFWASINNGDHGEYTEADQGKHCPAYSEK